MNAPIFVVGTPRSGTTLTARILGKHSRIFMPGETHFFQDIFARRSEFGPLNHIATAIGIIGQLSTIYERYNEPEDQKRIATIFKDTRIIDDFRSKCKSYRDVLSWFLELQMRYEGKMRWGNQVPRDIFNTSDILDFYPDAKFVVCLRDIRDFLVSYKSKWKTAKLESNQKRLKSIYHPVITSLLWKASIKQIDQLQMSVSEKNRIIIHYEKMVQAPEATIRAICDCIGEPFEPKMLNINFSNSSFKRDQPGIFQSSIGRWQEMLTAEEAFLAQKICYRELRSKGYDIVKVPCNIVKLLPIITMTPIALIRALAANKGLMGNSMSKFFFNKARPLFSLNPRQ